MHVLYVYIMFSNDKNGNGRRGTYRLYVTKYCFTREVSKEIEI